MSGPLRPSRNLLWNLVRRDLTVRYKSTMLGFLWSFAKPLAYMLIYQAVFAGILKIRLEEPRIPYALHVLAGVLPWSFMTGACAEAMNSILASANLVKKVRLPLEVFPLAAVCSHAIHFLMAMAVLVAGMILCGLPPGPAILLTPLAFAVQFILTLALANLLAALNVFYRDVASIWEVGSTAWFYATPVIYPAYYALRHLEERGWDWAGPLYLLNPMTPVVMAYRRFLLYGALPDPRPEPPGDAVLAASLAGAAAASLLMLAAARWIFARLSRRFADEL